MSRSASRSASGPPADGRGRRVPKSPGGSHRGLGGEQVEGRQAVAELLRARRRPVVSVLMAEGMDESPILDEIERLAAAARVRLEHVPRRRIEAVARTDSPQGVVATARPVEEVSLESLGSPRRPGSVPFLVVGDGITDPHNLGAVLRSAECAGATGVVLPSHRSAHLSPTVAKVAAGAIEYLPIALVPGIPAALRKLSTLGVWTVGLAAEADRSLYELEVGPEPVALVLGSESTGLSPLARKRCDALASLPQHGSLASLNVSTAAAVACFELARQRSASSL